MKIENTQQQNQVRSQSSLIAEGAAVSCAGTITGLFLGAAAGMFLIPNTASVSLNVSVMLGGAGMGATTFTAIDILVHKYLDQKKTAPSPALDQRTVVPLQKK